MASYRRRRWAEEGRGQEVGGVGAERGGPHGTPVALSDAHPPGHPDPCISRGPRYKWWGAAGREAFDLETTWEQNLDRSPDLPLCGGLEPPGEASSWFKETFTHLARVLVVQRFLVLIWHY